MSSWQEKARSSRAAELVRWYLRFNGYFSIENFIIHEADDPKRIKDGLIPEMTELDIVAVRLPYSLEDAQNMLMMANHELLVDGGANKIDVILGEIKTGKSNSPNKRWVNASQHKGMIEYVVRFCGVMPDGKALTSACQTISKHYCYNAEAHRIRYMMFCNSENDRHKERGVSYITYKAIIEFLVSIRGQSWTEAGVGVASRHQQWDARISGMFRIANDDSLSMEKKLEAVTGIFDLG